MSGLPQVGIHQVAVEVHRHRRGDRGGMPQHLLHHFRVSALRTAERGCAPRAGLWPWRGPARRARAVLAELLRQVDYGPRAMLAFLRPAVFLALDSPARGHRPTGAAGGWC